MISAGVCVRDLACGGAPETEVGEREIGHQGPGEREDAESLGADLQRLIDLQKLNDHIRPEEIALAQEQLKRTRETIQGARLRLDSLRLLLEGPIDD